MHSGRAWASDTITAYQGERLLSRGLVLLNTVEPDLMRHSPTMPDVPGPRRGDAQPVDHRVPRRRGAAWSTRPTRSAPTGRRRCTSGRATPESYDSVAANQAHRSPGPSPASSSAWPCARTPHINIADAHTLDLHRRDLAHRALPRPRRRRRVVAGRAGGELRGQRAVFGSGAVFTQDGTLVSTFAQDSMARVEGTIDPKRGM